MHSRLKTYMAHILGDINNFLLYSNFSNFKQSITHLVLLHTSLRCSFLFCTFFSHKPPQSLTIPTSDIFTWPSQHCHKKYRRRQKCREHIPNTIHQPQKCLPWKDPHCSEMLTPTWGVLKAAIRSSRQTRVGSYVPCKRPTADSPYMPRVNIVATPLLSSRDDTSRSLPIRAVKPVKLIARTFVTATCQRFFRRGPAPVQN